MLMLPPTKRTPVMLAEPVTSKLYAGEALLIPTLLLVVSTLKTLVSTEKSPDTERLANVDAPETVNVSETRWVGLRVMGPIPPVLVGGRE